MPTGLQVVVTLLCLSVSLLCQATGDKSASETVTLPDLGVRYTPPDGMVDKTSPEARQARDHANSYKAKAAQLLLDVSTGQADDSPEWRQVWMFHFPRAQLANLSDLLAEAKMNIALAGPKAQPIGQPTSAFFAGHGFLVSEFDQDEPPLKKHAKIYTTICKTQLISLVLVVNAEEQMKSLEDSLRSLNFSSE